MKIAIGGVVISIGLMLFALFYPFIWQAITNVPYGCPTLQVPQGYNGVVINSGCDAYAYVFPPTVIFTLGLVLFIVSLIASSILMLKKKKVRKKE